MSEMLVRDRIARLYAEAAHDRLARTASGPSRAAASGAGTGAWWRRLMGMPVATPGRRPATGRLA